MKENEWRLATGKDLRPTDERRAPKHEFLELEVVVNPTGIFARSAE